MKSFVFMIMAVFFVACQPKVNQTEETKYRKHFFSDDASITDLTAAINAINDAAQMECVTFYDSSDKSIDRIKDVAYVMYKSVLPDEKVGEFWGGKGPHLILYFNSRPNEPERGQAILVHEIGHALGLIHTDEGIMTGGLTVFTVKEAAESLIKILKDQNINHCNLD